MRAWPKALITTLGSAVLIAALMTPAAAADQWKDYGASCDEGAFKTPDAVDVKAISKCVRLWLAYKTPTSVKGDYKSRVAAAFKRLYVQGSDKDAKLARNALYGMQIRDLPERGATASSKATAKTSKKAARKRFEAPEPSAKQKKSADRHFKNGIKDYKKKKYDKALADYMKMVDVAPGYAKGHYNVACMHAMTGNEPAMATYLQNIADLGAAGNEDSAKLLKMARDDSDFAGVKNDSVAFKRITGFARIKILNAMDDAGEENVDNLEASLKKLGYTVEEVSPSTKRRKFPIVWYVAHAKPVAYFAKKLLNHPKTAVVEFTSKQLKGLDVVIVWGDDVKKGEDGKVYVSDPADAEEKIDGLIATQDGYLNQADDQLDEVDDTLSTPDKITSKAEDKVENVEKRIDKIGDTIDKAGGLFD